MAYIVKDMFKPRDTEERLALFDKYMQLGLDLEVVKGLKVQLQNMGFFEAPASRSFHGNYEGGLFDHSLKVTECLMDLTSDLELSWTRPESPYLIGMLHDICKCDLYERDTEKCEYVYKNDSFLSGHGDKSVILAQKLVNLTPEEIVCIRWHMGAFDDKSNWNYFTRAVEAYPNVLWTHTADMMAAHIYRV